MSQYYQEMKRLAQEIRGQYGLATPRVLRSDLRAIYKDQGIRIDLWPPEGVKPKFCYLRGAYMNDRHGVSVMLHRQLPDDPAIFTLGHELKHHLVDKKSALCDQSNQKEEIEIGAEIFAAELIFPDQDFVAALSSMGIKKGNCTPEHVVQLKHETRTTLSHQALAKKAEVTGFIPHGQFDKVRWFALQTAIYGEPFYKRRKRKGGS